VFLFAAVSAHAQTATPGPGVPLDVATKRAANIGDLRYELSLSIPSELVSPLSGSTTIRFTLQNSSQPLVLDFDTSRGNVKSVEANDKAATFSYVNGHIVMPPAALVSGANSVRIVFDAGDASLNRNADFLYTLFVPARARLALPVFDQPDLKGRWSVTLEHPAAWQSAANGAELERTTAGDRTRVRFAETEPLPTYLVAFICGAFKVETAERNGRTFRMFHRETDAAKVTRNREAIFDLHARALEYLERYTDIPYGFGKFDFVLIPAFQFGGMEHAGKILYNASGLMLDESATQNQLLGRASTIAHETAHMWFGDLVTMRWFDDVWMKEVFASFMAAKIVNPSFPTVNHDLRFLLSNYPSAYEVDRTAGANPIRQPLDNLQEAGSLYGNIIYQKAPVVMRHLEAVLGDDNFRDGLREYLKSHAFGNATWTDLIDVLDRRTPVDLQQWSRAWVDEPGRPTITTELSSSNGVVERLAFRQSDPRGRGLTWPQQLLVAIGTATGEQMLTADMTGSVAEVPGAAGMTLPRYILPMGGGWAYGDFVLDQASLDYLTANLPEIDNALTRGSAWITLWDAVLDGRLRPDRLIDLGLRALPRETDEQMTSRILGYASKTWWRFLGPAERAARAARFESVLRQGLAAAATPSQKAAWFGTLRDVALTPDTVGWLREVWEKKQSVPGLPLAENDYSALAQELAVRQVDGWKDVLTAQLGRIENADRKGRFQFVMPALSADPREREQWFLSLSEVNNRRREPWVLDGLSYLHHPLRAESSKKYIKQSLDMLWDIQKTGDIFFPKRWLDATLGGDNTRDVADTVRAFLKDLPATYPDRLRNITLQSADELFRAADVVNK
jgi:aminopeptidase N